MGLAERSVDNCDEKSKGREVSNLGAGPWCVDMPLHSNRICLCLTEQLQGMAALNCVRCKSVEDSLQSRAVRIRDRRFFPSEFRVMCGSCAIVTCDQRNVI